MNLLQLGQINIKQELVKLGIGWDGYEAAPIKTNVIEAFMDMTFVSMLLNEFKKVGFQEKDVEVIPNSEGNIQFEACNKNVYLEITITEEYYNKWEAK